MSKHIVILGAGTGGTLTANRLRRRLKQEANITVIDQDGQHLYQPGLLFVPFGLSKAEDIVRPREAQLHSSIEYIQSAIESVDIEANQVKLANGATISYHVLVVATGAALLPAETPGLEWNDSTFTFYDLEGSTALAAALEDFDAGHIVVNIVDMPIKCPVAPLEFCFLADWYFQERGVRDDVKITLVTPLDAAFTKPTAAKQLGDMLKERNIEIVTEFNTGEVDNEAKKLIGYDGREVEFDLAVIIPIHGGAAYVARSPGLGDALDFVLTDPSTLQSKVKSNVFAIGDATNIPASKAGSVTHFEGDVLVENICNFLAGEELDSSYDGHANCFIETGFGKALLIDFNYEQEPVPGHFPAAVGLPLLAESRLNHLGKLMFQWVYWHGLLPGRDIPGIGAAMPTSGKQIPTS